MHHYDKTFSTPRNGAKQSWLVKQLMCGSNAAGEAMPLHVMFSSKAEGENMAIK